MSLIANIATYPGRRGQSVEAIRSIAGQVDQVNVVLNEYVFVPQELRSIPRTNFIFPRRDIKNVGKFLPPVEDDDDVFLCDDDILYPGNYVERMMEHRARFAHMEPIVGLHGVTYSDYYEGTPRCGRLVFGFTRASDRPMIVNQLGTGTIHCKGYQMAPFAFMEGSERFVDVRFARHAKARGYPNICVAREAQWLRQIEVEVSIFESFTAAHPLDVVQEIQEIAGFRNIDAGLVAKLAQAPA